jgi:hypothetical protein
LESQLLARGDEFPFTLVPFLVTTAPTLAFAPFTPFYLSAHITLLTKTTSTITITVIFIRDINRYYYNDGLTQNVKQMLPSSTSCIDRQNIVKIQILISGALVSASKQFNK